VDAVERELFVKEVYGVYNHVLARGVMLVKRYPSYAHSRATITKAAEDLAQEAVVRTLSGERTRDPAKWPDIVIFMEQTMRSILCSEMKRLKRQGIALDGAGVDDEHPADAKLGLLDDRARGFRDPLLEMLGREECDQILEAVLDAAEDDPNVEKVANALMDGGPKPEDIAQETGLSVKQVYQVKRKLLRRLGSIEEVLS